MIEKTDAKTSVWKYQKNVPLVVVVVVTMVKTLLIHN